MGANLVTLAEYKAYALIKGDSQDAQIKAIIPSVSALVKSVCRRTFVDFVDDPKVQIFNGGEYFPLKEYPVISVLSVEKSNDYGATYSSLTEYQDYVLDIEQDRIIPVPKTTFNTSDNPYAYQYSYPKEVIIPFSKAINGYKITYLAGFEELPVELKLAIFDLITYYLRNDGAVHSPKAPGSNSVQIEYITNTQLPAHIKRVLDLYAADYL